MSLETHRGFLLINQAIQNKLYKVNYFFDISKQSYLKIAKMKNEKVQICNFIYL